MTVDLRGGLGSLKTQHREVGLKVWEFWRKEMNRGRQRGLLRKLFLYQNCPPLSVLFSTFAVT
jgi:hypothetical protein